MEPGQLPAAVDVSEVQDDNTHGRFGKRETSCEIIRTCTTFDKKGSRRGLRSRSSSEGT